MWSDSTTVFLLIAIVGVLMASNRLRFDVIALLVVVVLMLTGILTVDQSLSGFGSPVVILVAALLVVGEMLDRTGVAAGIGDWILAKGGGSETRLYIVIMAATGALGMAMSSTAVVAIFIPIVLRVSAETGHSASRLLMPMSYAALISGMLTLIATTPNLVVSEELKDHGYQAFGFFSFTPVGLAVLAVAIGYIVLGGRKLLPAQLEQQRGLSSSRSLRTIWEDYRDEREIHAQELAAGSTLLGRSLADADIERRYGVRVLGILRVRMGVEERIAAPASSTVLGAEDTLLLVGSAASLRRMQEEAGLATRDLGAREMQRWLWELGGATLLLHPDSALQGKTLHSAEFRSRYNCHVLGMRRAGAVIAEFEDVKLAPADSLLVMGPWSKVRQLRAHHHDFVVMEMPAEEEQVVPAYRRKPLALIILALMVLLTVFDVVPLVAAVLLAALAAGFTRCLTMEDAYRSIHWSSLVLVAGMLPLADALEQTGGTDIVVDALMYGVGDAGAGLMMTVLFFLTAALGLFLSNTASAVLVAPVAIAAAETLQVSPYPFAVAVLIAASAAFVTPFSTPVVTLVVEPGRYRFLDFVKMGLPLLLLTWLTTLLVTPLIFPYSG